MLNPLSANALNSSAPQLGPVARPRSHDLGDLTVADVLHALLRRWPVIVIGVVLFAILGAVANVLLPPSYVSEGFLVVDARRSSIPEIGVVSVQAADPRIPRSEAKVLIAPEFIEELVGRLNLGEVPFIAEKADAKEPAQSAERESASADQRFAARRAAAIDWLIHNLKVRGEDRSYAITVSTGTPDSALSAKIVNAAMALYLERRGRDDAALVERASHSIAQRFAGIRDEVRELEQQILAEHRELDLVSTKAGRVEALDLVKLTEEQRSNERRLSELREWLTRAEHAAETKNWQDVDNTIASPYLLKLLEQEALAARLRADAAASFGPKHPDVVKASHELASVHARLRVEVQRIAATLKAQIEALTDRQAVLAAQIRGQQLSSVEAQQKEERIRQREDELASKRELLAAYETRLQQLTASVGAAAGAVRVGAWATPALKPAGPSAPLLVSLSALLGAFLSGIYVVLARRFGDRLESADEIVAVAGLPVLGAVPEIAARARTTPRLIWAKVRHEPHGVVAESIRALLVRMQFALKDGHGVLLITSARAGDGKTSLALAMAQQAVMSGKRVLLVDADLFRAGATRATGIALPLASEQSVTTSILHDRRSGIHVLPASRNFTPLQQSRALDHLSTIIAEARERYDLIIVDTPPVMHVSDALLLVPYADAVMLVTSWRRASRSALIGALERIEATGRPVSGIALSRVPRRSHQARLYSGYARGARRASSASLREAFTFVTRPPAKSTHEPLPRFAASTHQASPQAQGRPAWTRGAEEIERLGL
jgi:uncharacterized protein involved in exopolysaccharide biosynthesis